MNQKKLAAARQSRFRCQFCESNRYFHFRRSPYWKQWRRVRTRIQNLRKLGIREDEAVTRGVSSKSPWVLSSSQAVHEALSLDYLAGQGLASLLTIWQKLTAKEMNRPVRTRTPGGVGGASEQSGSLSRFLLGDNHHRRATLTIRSIL